MRKLLVILIAVALISGVVVAIAWACCGGSEPITIYDIKADPNPVPCIVNDIWEEVIVSYTIMLVDISGPTTDVWVYVGSTQIYAGNYMTGGTFTNTVIWNPSAPGTYGTRVEATNGQTTISEPGPDIVVEPCNNPPVANAGPDQTVEQTKAEGADVTLDGSGSSDPDGDPLTYKWTWDGGEATGVNPIITFPLGTTTITLIVNDGELDSEPDTVNITVEDTTPPVITPTDTVHVLWPPNHKYHTITILDCVASVEDICDVNVGVDDVVITSVSSDEPENGNQDIWTEATGGGDGNTNDDIIIVDSQTVQLRAERQGGGNGRVYTINYQVTDASGNTATGSSQVSVPHDQDGEPAVDDGPGAGYTVVYP